MVQAYTFRMPTAIVSGAGVAGQAGEQLAKMGAKRVLVVTDPVIAKTPHLKTVTDSLARAGLAYEVFARVEPDPSIDVVESNAAEVAGGNYDAFVALGGGSSIDVAKGLRLLAQFGGKLRDYAPGDKVPGDIKAPLLAISTTAGTGSQVSYGAVFSDNARGTKFAVVSPKMAPTLALNDPVTNAGAPAKVTGASGMDALAHAVEAYISKQANPIADIWSLEAIKIIGAALPKAMADLNDLEARDQMLMASTIAIVPASICGLGADHAVAMPLCSLLHLPHGLVVGTMLAAVMEYNLDASTERLATVAAALGVETEGLSKSEAAARGVARVRELSRLSQLPTGMQAVGLEESLIDKVAGLTMESFQVNFNPRQMSAASVAEMLRKSL
ncbi:MAG: iron-containing alcohol dehydrogenase family protein [Chloroflexota bacterium]